MADTVSYDLQDKIAVLSIDDGKANAISHDVLNAIHEGLDRAKDDGAGALVLAGRPGMFSGGFDLKVMRGGDFSAVIDLVTSGGEMILRLYQSPMPIVAACTGHAVAAGALTLMGSHHRVGAEGDFRIVLIETTIGMVLPDWAIELSSQRLSKRHVQPAAIESFVYGPQAAVDAGFLDRVVPADAVLDAAIEEATRLAALPAAAYAGNAQKVRGPGAERLAALLAKDRAGAT